MNHIMAKLLQMLVFSDLDGTLIDHDTYRWDAATPALGALKRIGAGIVLASSKTGAELVALREEMGLAQWPAIVENGAGIIQPFCQEKKGIESYQLLRNTLDQLPTNLRQYFCGFGDMQVSEVVEVTGLSREFACLAKQRNYSEPGLWRGTESQLNTFITTLAKHNIFARAGGRFLTLSYGQTKADRMGELIKQYQPCFTVALGDAPNDVEMIQSADIGVIVANPHSGVLPELENECNARVIRTTLPGPQGWNDAILGILAKLKLR